MRVTPVNFSSGIRQTNFKGQVHRVMVNVGTDEDVITRFKPDMDEIYVPSGQVFIPGEVPLKKVEGTYTPDVLVEGNVYYAEHHEWVGKWAKTLYSGVVADENRNNLTIERAKHDEKDGPDELASMQQSIDRDILHQKNRLMYFRIDPDKVEKEELERLKDPEYEPASFYSDPQDIYEQEIYDYLTMLAVKKIVDFNYKETLRSLKEDYNYDYYLEKKTYDTNPDPYYLKMRKKKAPELFGNL